MSDAPRTYLVTGAMGCIGSWALRHLHQRGDKVISVDVGNNRSRLDLLMSASDQEDIVFEQGDLRDSNCLPDLIERHGVNRIIHLAALQVPFCKADPVMGAAVNVVGTVNVFEAARKAGIHHIAYASSVAVYGPPSLYPDAYISDESQRQPHTFYGVYKVANEDTARVYWQDHHISSTAFRPYTVYGVGRDQGLTSEPTKAMLAAAKGEAYEIGFSGVMQFQLASDIARYFIEGADQPHKGAAVFNIGTPSNSVEEVVEMIRKARSGARITGRQNDLPFPTGLDGSALRQYLPEFRETPLQEGIEQTITHFEKCLAEGKPL